MESWARHAGSLAHIPPDRVVDGYGTTPEHRRGPSDDRRNAIPIDTDHSSEAHSGAEERSGWFASQGEGITAHSVAAKGNKLARTTALSFRGSAMHGDISAHRNPPVEDTG